MRLIFISLEHFAVTLACPGSKFVVSVVVCVLNLQFVLKKKNTVKLWSVVYLVYSLFPNITFQI